MEWLLSHEEEPETEVDSPQQEQPNTSEPVPESTEAENTQALVAKSIKCEDCGKLFQTQAEIEFHSAKTGHENFAESTEEKQPLTDEEKKERLAKIEEKLRQRRLEREAREKEEEILREKSRIRSGKEILEAKKKHEEMEIKKMVEQHRREKEEDRLARQRVREQIEQDKANRRAKFGGGSAPEPAPVVQPKSPVKPAAPPANYTETNLQIRLTNGDVLKQKFHAKEPLSAVKLYIELNRQDGDGPFNLMMTFPRRVFGPDDFDKPLELLGE